MPRRKRCRASLLRGIGCARTRAGMSDEKRRKWDWPAGGAPGGGLPRARYGHWFVAGFWIVLLVILLVTMFYTVPADSVAVVQRFGKYVRTEDPGLRFKW